MPTPKPDRVAIRLSFPHPVYGTFTPVKVEYEYPLGSKDNDQDALDDGKRRAEEWFKKNYPPLDTATRSSYPDPPYQVTDEPAADVVGDSAEVKEWAFKFNAEPDKSACEELLKKAPIWCKYNPVIKSIINAKP